jgi:hypothetical protein
MLQQQKKKPEKLPKESLTACNLYHVSFVVVITSGKMVLTFIVEGNLERFKRGRKARGSNPGNNKGQYLPSKIVQTGPVIHTASYAVAAGVLSSE